LQSTRVLGDMKAWATAYAAPSRSGTLMSPGKLRFRAQLLTAILTATDMSLPVPLHRHLSVKENDYEQRRSQVRVLLSALLNDGVVAGIRAIVLSFV
jgi:hypothetical protein